MTGTTRTRPWFWVLVALAAVAAGTGYLALSAPDDPPSGLATVDARARQASGATALGDVVSANAARGLSSDAKQARLDSLAKLVPAAILPTWRDDFARNDLQNIPWVVAAMGQSLRRSPDTAVYRALAEIVSDARLSIGERLAALNALGYAATPEAMAIVLAYLRGADASQNPSDAGDAVIEHARETVKRIAYTFVDGARNWDVVPELARSLRDPAIQSSRRTLIVVADALRYLASPEAAQALVETQIGATPESPVVQVVAAAVSRFTAPDVVDVLGTTIGRKEVSADVQRTLVAALVSVGNLASINYLAGYLNRPEQERKVANAEILSLMTSREFSPEALKAMRYWEQELRGTNSAGRTVFETILRKAAASKP